MSESIITKDILFHNQINKMSAGDKIKYIAMLKINHILNCALEDDRERSSGKCYVMQFSRFLDKIRIAFDDTLFQVNQCKNNIIIFDDFIRIADYAYVAVKEIINNPSTQLEKMSCKVQIQKATGMGIKTMKWMAERPGRNVKEKVSPQNKVLTEKTIFSVDTKENREFMYMHRILHDAILARVSNTECRNCNNSQCRYYAWVMRINKLFSLNAKLRKTDLSDVRPIKQPIQNNKLMCDKNYRIVWNAVKMLSGIEDKIFKDFNEMLESRFAMIIYWIILSKLISYDNVLIHDFIGRFYDKDGIIGFGTVNKENKVQDSRVLIVKNDNGGYETEYTIKIIDTDIKIINKNGNEIYSFSSKGYFDMNGIMTEDNEEKQNGQ